MNDEELQEYLRTMNDVYEFQSPMVRIEGHMCAYTMIFKRKDRLPLTRDELPKLLQATGYRMLKLLEQERGDT